ncbi:hypothetical protein Tco_0917471 [Tanacetum coccineum]
MAESSTQEQIPQQQDQPQDPGTPIPYDPAPQVDYEPSQIHFKDNNEVALIYPEHPNKEHFRIEIVSWRLYEACGVCILELKDGTVIYMLVKRRYPLFKELLQRMLIWDWEVKRKSNYCTYIRCIHVYGNEALTSSKDTAFGKDKSNPLIVDSLLKTIRLSIHLVVYNEELAILEQTATGKGISNLLMAGSLPKTTKPT